MDSFRAALEARSPARRCLRAYDIEVTEDLFGAWLLRISDGRIGTPDRTKVRSLWTDIEAAAQVEDVPAQASQRAAPGRCGAPSPPRGTWGGMVSAGSG
jgi:hypothetical protein